MKIEIDLMRINNEGGPKAGRVAAVALLSALPVDEAELAIIAWDAARHELERRVDRQRQFKAIVDPIITGDDPPEAELLPKSVVEESTAAKAEAFTEGRVTWNKAMADAKTRLETAVAEVDAEDKAKAVDEAKARTETAAEVTVLDTVTPVEFERHTYRKKEFSPLKRGPAAALKRALDDVAACVSVTELKSLRPAWEDLAEWLDDIGQEARGTELRGAVLDRQNALPSIVTSDPDDIPFEDVQVSAKDSPEMKAWAAEARAVDDGIEDAGGAFEDAGMMAAQAVEPGKAAAYAENVAAFDERVAAVGLDQAAREVQGGEPQNGNGPIPTAPTDEVGMRQWIRDHIVPQVSPAEITEVMTQHGGPALAHMSEDQRGAAALTLALAAVAVDGR